MSVLPEVLREPSGLSGAAQYDVSDNGTLIYLSGDVRPRILRTLEWVDRQGTPESIDARPHNYRTPRISPDGTKIALTVRENGSEGGIWIWDRARKILIPVPVGPGLSRYPVWSSGSEQLAHVWRPVTGGVTTWLYRRSVDGSGDRTLLAETPERIYPTSFLPDGTSLLLSGFVNGPSNQDIATVPLDGSEPPNALWETPFSNEQHPEVSPDGRWLAYDSDESGNEEVWVRPYPNVQGGRHPISVRGGSRPLWSPDGMELFYRNDDTVMAVAINTSSDFTAGDPVPLFGGYPIIGQGGRDYDTRDGENFVMIKQLEGASADASIIVVENWFEELRRLAPAE